jgi:UPF0755 protein
MYVLASIVELEAKVQDEKPTIAGLYLNRLNRNMLLQADPTVAYAIGERRRLLFEDYRYEHPYNTYIHCRPATRTRLQIRMKPQFELCLKPEEHNYLFMVASPDGSHQF